MSNANIDFLMILGICIFVIIWAYSFLKWDFLIALMVGWIPSVIGAGVIMILVSLILSHSI